MEAQPHLRRYHDEIDDQRSPGERDRDRVLYSSAFARLTGVTQVVASDEGYPYHNRLMHSLKVAQVARRVAENLIRKQPTEAAARLLDPDVCEAVALAHDLGHPPFGHIAEKQLDQLVVNSDDEGTPRGLADGFEANAQSFRIVTKLAQRRDDFDGLNLTFASLNGILKYPWLRSGRAASKHRNAKYGAYESEREIFNRARELEPEESMRRSVDAEIMNWADDVAYAVHDVEDFYRAGLIPLDRLHWSEEERRRLLDWIRDRWWPKDVDDADDAGTTDEPHSLAEGTPPPISLDDWDVASRTLTRLLHETPLNRLTRPYEARRVQRNQLRHATAYLIGQYLNAVSLTTDEDSECWLTFAIDRVREVAILKELVWYYVIDRPSLRTQQRGQERVIKDLFDIYRQAAEDDLALLPWSMREAIAEGANPYRAAADVVSSLTEHQAILIWQKLTGISAGSLADYPQI